MPAPNNIKNKPKIIASNEACDSIAQFMPL